MPFDADKAVYGAIDGMLRATGFREVLAHKMKFLEMMDDDFNTAGAIAALHELASAVNAFIEGARTGKLENAAFYAADSTLTAIMAREAIYKGKEMTWDQLLKG